MPVVLAHAIFALTVNETSMSGPSFLPANRSADEVCTVSMAKMKYPLVAR
jgi:hypothetical protein